MIELKCKERSQGWVFNSDAGVPALLLPLNSILAAVCQVTCTVRSCCSMSLAQEYPSHSYFMRSGRNP